MNASQRRKARRKGEWWNNTDKDVADDFSDVLYNLNLADTAGIFGTIYFGMRSYVNWAGTVSSSWYTSTTIKVSTGDVSASNKVFVGP
jgi:hypothetical protein